MRARMERETLLYQKHQTLSVTGPAAASPLGVVCAVPPCLPAASPIIFGSCSAVHRQTTANNACDGHRQARPPIAKFHRERKQELIGALAAVSVGCSHRLSRGRLAHALAHYVAGLRDATLRTLSGRAGGGMWERKADGQAERERGPECPGQDGQSAIQDMGAPHRLHDADCAVKRAGGHVPGPGPCGVL